MSNYSKFNIVYRLQKWMDSVPGQTFLNYAYSWGAAIVILGTLFKLTHLPGANLMLFLGMGTEVLVFFLSAFDRPFDKTADGIELPSHPDEAYLSGKDIDKHEIFESSINVMPQSQVVNTMEVVVPQIGALPDDFVQTTEDYVTQLRILTETLAKVNEQSQRLTQNSEEMENLNRTLTGITRVYEMQLRGVSGQLGTIDQINERNRIMSEQIEQLNKIYARMIEAMTANHSSINH